ncbi:hypothetical protein HU200_053587 [Digitaria exilis]|uniref:Uncharacterized protein n=1 Tax=Digitaria exilis TaxID=1010633 RepID=A0A835AMN4_9POAL|nr:hypothetical protein HU200_053587 [Digitaria exilis]
MEIQGPLPTPCKRRARKLKEPLDTKFLRRSARTSLGLGGFRNKEAAKEYEDSAASPLDPPAPHLSVGMIQGIAIGFLHMQPSVVSASALLDLDNDDDAM